MFSKNLWLSILSTMVIGSIFLLIWASAIRWLMKTTIQYGIDQTQSGNIISYKPTERWRLNSNNLSQRYIELTGTDRTIRIQQLLDAYNLDSTESRPAIRTIARIYDVYPEVIVCIAYADSSIGRFLKTTHNYGNVGNNDRGDTQTYTNLEKWFNAIGKTLNNQYLNTYISIDQLSRRGNKTGMVYATSDENRHINVMNCLGMIRNKRVPDNFAFRF